MDQAGNLIQYRKCHLSFPFWLPLESEDFSDSSEAVSGNGSGRKSDSIPEVPLELSILVAFGLDFPSKHCGEFGFETFSVSTSLVEKSESRVSSLNCCLSSCC